MRRAACVSPAARLPENTSAAVRRPAAIAGSTPVRIAAATMVTKTSDSTRRSTAASEARGRSGMPDRNSCIANQASATPNVPPAAVSTKLSASCWQTSRPRVAPSAARTPISRPRVTPRASSRLATLAQATSITQATIAMRTSSGRRTSPTMLSCNVVTVTLHPRLVSCCSPSLTAIVRSVSVAAPGVAPGASLPMTSR